MAGLTGLHQCRDCLTAASVLRRLGFQDTISWGPIDNSPTLIAHGYHANSGAHVDRVETEAEYKNRTGAPDAKAPVEGARGRKHSPFGLVRREYQRQPLCTHYRNELAWLMAGKPVRTTVYLAHPVADDFAANVENVTAWFRYLRGLSGYSISELVGFQYDYKPLILCPWLAGIQPDGESPGGREGMLADCRDTVMMFDEVWLLWRVTEGMAFESRNARVVRDLTHLGKTPPMAKVLPFHKDDL